MKGKILDLENISYLVLEEVNHLGRTIILAAEVNTTNDTIDENNLIVKEIVGDEVKSLTDPQEIDLLTKLLLNKYSSKI